LDKDEENRVQFVADLLKSATAAGGEAYPLAARAAVDILQAALKIGGATGSGRRHAIERASKLQYKAIRDWRRLARAK